MQSKASKTEMQDDLDDMYASLEETQSQFKTMKTSFTKIQEELEATKTSLAKTEDELKATQKELKSTKTSFETTRKQLTETKKQIEEIHPVSLMRELHKFTQTNQVYASQVRRLFNAIAVGELYQINAPECFFKLTLIQQNRGLQVTHCKDVKTLQNAFTVFSNDSITLNDDGLHYYLFVSIKNLEKANIQCVLIDTKQNRRNCLLDFGIMFGGINWGLHRNEMGEVIFYFNKK